MLHDMAEAIQATPFAQFIAESSWAFPAVESVHVVFLVLVVGSIIVLDLRLVGISPRHLSVRAVSGDVLPLTWTGFAMALLSGLTMFSAKAADYIANPAFLLKMGLMALAGINMLAFHFLTYRSVARWDVDVAPPAAARVAGGLSLAFWTAIVVCGRWIGFI